MDLEGAFNCASMARGRRELTVSVNVDGVGLKLSSSSLLRLPQTGTRRVRATSRRRSALSDHRSASHSTHVPTARISLYLYCTLQPLLTTTLCTCSSYWVGVCRAKRNSLSPGHRSPLSRLPHIFRRPTARYSIRLSSTSQLIKKSQHPSDKGDVECSK